MTSVIKDIKNNENKDFDKYYLEEKCYYGKNCRGFRSGKCPYNHYDLRGVIKSNVKKLPYGFCKFECLDPSKNIRCKRKVCSFDHLKGKIKFVNGTDKVKLVESKGTITEDINNKINKSNEIDKEDMKIKSNNSNEIKEKNEITKDINVEVKKECSNIEVIEEYSNFEVNNSNDKKTEDHYIKSNKNDEIKKKTKINKKVEIKGKKGYKKNSKYNNKNKSKYTRNFEFNGCLMLDEKNLSSI